MILGLDKLYQRIRDNGLVQKLCQRELDNPEGAGFDIRLGEVHKIIGNKAFLGIETRETPEMQLLAKYDPKIKRSFIFPSNSYYVVATVEIFRNATDLVILPKPRATLFRLGIDLLTTYVAPGYEGTLTFGLKNTGPIDVEVELGARFAHICFFQVLGETKLYRGQWKGGRITTKGEEKQI